MGSCIICGQSVDGVTCKSHDEDVAFEFRGSSPDQLVVGRFYRGTVDGFADFGAFVNLDDRVTGLLHRSEVEGRLESLDWDEGDPVFVQVTGVHDNGNVDLGWSIRQSEREFRGRAIQDPSADEEEVVVDTLEGESAAATDAAGGADEGNADAAAETGATPDSAAATPDDGDEAESENTADTAERSAPGERPWTPADEADAARDDDATGGTEPADAPEETSDAGSAATGDGRVDADDADDVRADDGANDVRADDSADDMRADDGANDVRADDSADDERADDDADDETGSEFDWEGADEADDGTAESTDADGSQAAGDSGPATGAGEEADADPLERTSVAALDDLVGERVRLEAEVVDVRQTGGPTVFALADETARVECAAFVSAGERAYPDVEVGDLVALVGEVERRRGDLQVETESLEVLDGDDAATVRERLDAALAEEATPPETALFVADDAVEAAHDAVVEAATAVRRAVIESRPIVVRHTATVAGYLAGAALERAVLPMVRERHARTDAEFHYVERRPIDGEFYEMDDATKDVTDLLDAAERHGENHPLVVLADAGRTRESAAALELLETYDVTRVVLDAGPADEAAAEAVDAFCNVDADHLTAATVATHVAALVNPSVRDDLAHLPAASFWAEPPAAYAEAAADAGFDEAAVADVRGALALLAHYQTYEDKREISRDVLWGEDRAFTAHVASQFRSNLETELETVERHVDRRTVQGVPLWVVDLEAYTHRYDFPPGALLLDALHREARADADGPAAVLGLDEDELHVRGDVDVRAVGDAVAEALPDAGVHPRGAADGHLDFLLGERDAVLEAAVDEVAVRLAGDVEAALD